MAHQHQLKIACLNLKDADRMPLISAFNTAAATLNTDLTWTHAYDADIRIVDVTEVNPDSVPPVVIRYSTRQNGKPVDLVRPIHVRVLIEVLSNAIHQALALKAQKEAEATQTATMHYRGVAIEKNLSRPGAPEQSDRPRKKEVIYRGVKIE